MNPAPSILRVSPARAADLFAAFQRLDQGEDVVLVPAPAGGLRLEPAPAQGGPWLGVTSSGSTGLPKLAWRAWPELRGGAVTRPEVRGWTWATPYRLWSFAGVQAALQAWRAGGDLVCLAGSWGQIWDRLVQAGVQAVSATPTFLDLLLQNEGGANRAGQTAPEWAWSPRQITLGGEPLRPALGTRLARRWPEAHFTVIYAAAEFGVLLKTNRLDGWYELAFLNTRQPAWRVARPQGAGRNGPAALLTGPAQGAATAATGTLELLRDGSWVSTGDRVEVAGELIRVVGRADAVANVAGTKVSLAEVSELAEQVPGVRRAEAIAESNPVTGQIVCLKYALEPQADPREIAVRLEQHLRYHLHREAWPRRWVVDEVAPGVNGKRHVACGAGPAAGSRFRNC